MKTHFILVGLLICLAFFSCSESKLSPEDLIKKIEQSNHSATKDGQILSLAQGSEVQFWLLIDDDRVAAYCFDSPDTAKRKAQSFEQGYSNGCWAFDHIEQETIEILENAL